MPKMKTGGKRKGSVNKKRGGQPRNINPVVYLTNETQKKITRLLGRCVSSGLIYALKVLRNDEQLEVQRLNRFHQKEIVLEDRYSPEVKLKILEILVNKIYADRREPILEPTKDESALKVVSFDFVPLHPQGVPHDFEKANKNRIEGMKKSKAYQDRAKNRKRKKK